MSTKPIKILYAVGQLTIGGTELQLLELIKNLNRTLFEIRVVCLSGPSPLVKYFREIGCATDELETEKRGRLRSLWQLFLILKDFQPDIVHAYAYASRAVIPIAKLFRKTKIIVSIRTYPDWNLTSIEIISNRLANLILTNSEKAVTAVRTIWPKVPANVIKNGIDLDKFQKASQEILEAIPESAEMDPGITKISIVGRLESVKGHEDLIHAFRSIYAHFPKVQLWIIGDGPLRHSLTQLVNKLELEDYVVFWGERNDAPAILQHTAIGVNISRREGLSNAIIEYMAASLPIVATNVGGNSELIINDYNGLLVPPKNPNILADKIMFLIQNSPVAHRLGQNGRMFVESNLTMEKMVTETQDVYSKLLISDKSMAADYQ